MYTAVKNLQVYRANSMTDSMAAMVVYKHVNDPLCYTSRRRSLPGLSSKQLSRIEVLSSDRSPQHRNLGAVHDPEQARHCVDSDAHISDSANSRRLV